MPPDMSLIAAHSLFGFVLPHVQNLAWALNEWLWDGKIWPGHVD